jgi:hypothetical protein
MIGLTRIFDGALLALGALNVVLIAMLMLSL